MHKNILKITTILCSLGLLPGTILAISKTLNNTNDTTISVDRSISDGKVSKVTSVSGSQGEVSKDIVIKAGDVEASKTITNSPISASKGITISGGTVTFNEAAFGYKGNVHKELTDGTMTGEVTEMDEPDEKNVTRTTDPSGDITVTTSDYTDDTTNTYTRTKKR